MTATDTLQLPAQVGFGHDLVEDPESFVVRWTCRTCGDAVQVSSTGHVYGGAVDRSCAESQEFWGVTR